MLTGVLTEVRDIDIGEALTRRRKWTIAFGGVLGVAAALSATWLVVRPRLIAVRGREVEARIRGTGRPAVIFELGSAGGNLAYWHLQDSIASHAKTIVYERAGLGRSSLGAEPRSAEQIALELHGLLEATGTVAPYVLVGHSYGGLLIRVFAHRYPTEIAGLVFIDPATEGMYDHIQKETPREWEAAATALTEGFRRQWLGMPEAIDQARKAWPLPEVPTTVISADTPLGQWPLKTAQDVAVLQKEQMVLLAQISGASHVLVPHSDHMSILRRDEVALEILKILRSIRPQ